MEFFKNPIVKIVGSAAAEVILLKIFELVTTIPLSITDYFIIILSTILFIATIMSIYYYIKYKDCINNGEEYHIYRESEYTSNKPTQYCSGVKKDNHIELTQDFPDGQNGGIFGPYINLPVGKYKVVFTIRIDHFCSNDENFCRLDVTSHQGRRFFAARDINRNDFKQADEYKDFTLYFELLDQTTEQEWEFRLFMFRKNDDPVVVSFKQYVVYKKVE